MSKSLYIPCPLCCAPCLYALDRRKSIVVTISDLNVIGCVNSNDGGSVEPYQSVIYDGFTGGGFVLEGVNHADPSVSSPFFRFRATAVVAFRHYQSADMDQGHGCNGTLKDSFTCDLQIDVSCSLDNFWSVDVTSPASPSTPTANGPNWFSGSAKWGEAADNIYTEPSTSLFAWGWGGTATVELLP